MNSEEATKILAALSEAYPQKTSANPKLAATVWATVFADKPYDNVSTAVYAFISTDSKGFPPSPGQINTMLQQITTPAGLTDQEAWLLVKKGISNGRYGSEDEFAKLPADVQAAVGSHYALKEWADVPEDELATVVRSNFCRTYRAKLDQRKTWDALPEKVKAFAALAAADIKQIGGGAE